MENVRTKNVNCGYYLKKYYFISLNENENSPRHMADIRRHYIAFTRLRWENRHACMPTTDKLLFHHYKIKILGTPLLPINKSRDVHLQNNNRTINSFKEQKTNQTRMTHDLDVRRVANGVWCPHVQSGGSTSGTAPLWSLPGSCRSPPRCTAGTRSCFRNKCAPHWLVCDTFRLVGVEIVKMQRPPETQRHSHWVVTLTSAESNPTATGARTGTKLGPLTPVAVLPENVRCQLDTVTLKTVLERTVMRAWH